MVNKKVFNDLWENSLGHCAFCGKELEKNTAVIDHIIPLKKGGSNEINNLRLVCRTCNIQNANKLLPQEKDFQDYLYSILINDSRFNSVTSNNTIVTENGRKLNLDITFTRNIDGNIQSFAVEVKSSSLTSEQGLNSAVQQLKMYRSILPNYHFILASPITIAKNYRENVYSEGFSIWDSETICNNIPDIILPICSASDLYDTLITRLRDCRPGFVDWQVYQKLIGEIISALFCPPLDPLVEQNADANYANRRDFIIPNYSDYGYWPYLRNRYYAEFITVDAKNSAKTISKEDILQVAHYLKSKGTGLFGLVFSRFGVDESGIIHLRDIWQNENKMIIVMNDNDIEQMLLLKQDNSDPCQVIINLIQNFRLSL